MKRYMVPFILLAAMFSSCERFLDVKPKGVVLPEKLADYEAMFNSSTLTETFPGILINCTDDLQGLYSKNDRGSSANMYFWRPQLEPNTEVSPPVWGQLYRAIYNCNVVINYIGETSAAEQKKNEVLAEALAIRAECYFTLLTVFAKAYDQAAAATAPGLPLVTSTDVTNSTPPRATLQATFDEVIAHLKKASEHLPLSSKSKVRINRYGAYALLARVYLYMGDYSNALLYADKALAVPHVLLDLNEVPDRESMPIAELNPESLWVRFSENWVVPGYMIYSADLLSYLDENDLRLDYLTRDATPEERTLPNGNVSFGIGFPEVYLTKAESLARTGNRSEAMTIVNMLRAKRIKTAAYTDLSASSDEDALQKVLAERRRELAFSGLRWMDMKRLDREGRMPEVRRQDIETGEVLGSLPPKSPNYVFEIPSRVLLFNPGMTKNH
ncbi:RagB/SusD family nutrient uptake outer membrane protein [Pedobacter faecalis]|uniref:RagB/SusD family nutrient uptake outer membrane protein n=1 Tax=Pedobacter faecalis TaxID=3041495 RepID=UPI00254EBD34|nr:RagB/SusD family nutrient uptake outer membrane protein [Pedobacter sp. ELA7]